MLTDERIRLRATPQAWERLALYILLSPGEVGGLASVEADGVNLLITAVHLIDQQATDVDNELDSVAVSHFLIDYFQQGGDPGALRLWWHSHGREGVFWSADDQRTIDRFGSEWLVSLIGNHAGKFLARLDRFEPMRQTVGWVDFVPPGDPPPLDGPAAERARADLARHVAVVPRRTNKPWTDGDELPRLRELRH
jgi:hypothetical protein